MVLDRLLIILVENSELYSALVAVVGANLVLLGYILTAFADFDGDEFGDGEEGYDDSDRKKRKNE